MSYVVQQPHSNTNPTAQYTVIRYSDWRDYINGDTKIYPMSVKYFDTYPEARQIADALNSVAA